MMNSFNTNDAFDYFIALLCGIGIGFGLAIAFVCLVG